MIDHPRGGDSRFAWLCASNSIHTPGPAKTQNTPGFHRFRTHHIYDNAPLGSLIRYSDGTSKPPVRFNKKLAAWQNSNGVARLVRKQPQRDRPTHTSSASITFHEGDFASGGVVVLTVRRTYSVDSLRFEIVERPAVGAVRILQEQAGDAELLHLAENSDAAERWLTHQRYSNVRLEDVTEDEAGVDVVGGRAA